MYDCTFDFIHSLNYKFATVHRFGRLILRSRSGKNWLRGQRTYLLGPLSRAEAVITL